MDEGRFIQSRKRQTVPPARLVLINTGCPELAVVHGIKKMNEEFVRVLLSARSELVSPVGAAQKLEILHDRTRGDVPSVMTAPGLVKSMCLAQ